MTLRTPAFNDAKLYGFEWLRLSNELPLQEGVIGAGDFKVTAAAGGGQRIDLAAGIALVKGDSGVAGTGLSQGLYACVNDAAIANAATLAASDPTNPRIDQVCLQVRDTADLGSAGDDLQVIVLTGAASAGATLDNRTGAALLGNDKVRLADILVPAASAAVTAGNIRDRRPWARGAYVSAVGPVGNISTTSTTAVQMTSLFNKRLECSGAPLELCFNGVIQHSVAGGQVLINPAVDSVSLGLAGGMQAPAINNYETVAFQVPYAPVAGSHVFDMQWSITAGSGLAYTDATHILAVIYREAIRPNASN